MRMEEGLDSGPMLAWTVRPITPLMRKNELFEKLSEDAADLTPRILRDFKKLRPLPQCDADATYCRKITRADGLISFDLPAGEIYNRFRAYEGWPGIYLESGLKLLEIEPAEGSGRPGEILAVDDEGVTVACGEGALRITKLQPPSKKAMDAPSYIRGKRLQVADLLV
jgi:methionyl-tRNA formyltransferase